MKKQLSKGKIVKRIILSVLAVLLAAVIAVFLYVKFKILPQIQKYINDPEIISMLNDLQQEDLDAVLNTIDGVVEDPGDAPAAEKTPAPNPAAPSQAEIAKAVILPTLPPGDQPLQTPGNKTGNSGGKGDKIDALKSQIPAGDMAAATALAAKVDAGYILGLLSGGLTPEEKRELKEYLTSRLSGAEISRGIELYNKYAYLLK